MATKIEFVDVSDADKRVLQMGSGAVFTVHREDQMKLVPGDS